MKRRIFKYLDILFGLVLLTKIIIENGYGEKFPLIVAFSIYLYAGLKMTFFIFEYNNRSEGESKT